MPATKLFRTKLFRTKRSKKLRSQTNLWPPLVQTQFQTKPHAMSCFWPSWIMSWVIWPNRRPIGAYDADAVQLFATESPARRFLCPKWHETSTISDHLHPSISISTMLQILQYNLQVQCGLNFLGPSVRVETSRNESKRVETIEMGDWIIPKPLSFRWFWWSFERFSRL